MASTFSRRAFAAALAASVLALASGCGGGSSSDGLPAPAPAAPVAADTRISRVIVAGDSLADVGTFGFKATVQNAADPDAGYPVYPEIVATQLGAGPVCNHFASPDGEAFTTREGCTNFAVGGASIVNPITRGGSGVPFSVPFQLETAAAASGGAWRAGDLVLVDAGGNDAAALAEAFLDARGGGADAAVYLALLAQQLEEAEIAEALAQPDGESVAAGLYMQRLAQTWWNTLVAQALDKGATRVAVVDVPDISLTPRFRDAAAELAATEGAPAAAQFQADLRAWIAGFNAELARLAAGEPRVVVVPYFEDFSAQAATPAQFGLTNATDASCPPGDFTACTDAALDAAPPPGLAAGWWRTWFYSDGFHPSPRGHELLAATVERALARAGWR